MHATLIQRSELAAILVESQANDSPKNIARGQVLTNRVDQDTLGGENESGSRQVTISQPTIHHQHRQYKKSQHYSTLPPPSISASSDINTIKGVSKVDFDDYLDIHSRDYDAEYDSIETRLDPVTIDSRSSSYSSSSQTSVNGAGRKLESEHRSYDDDNGHSLNTQANLHHHRYPHHNYEDNLPGYPPPNDTNTSDRTLSSSSLDTFQADLSADGAGFIFESPRLSVQPSSSSDVTGHDNSLTPSKGGPYELTNSDRQSTATVNKQQSSSSSVNQVDKSTESRSSNTGQVNQPRPNRSDGPKAVFVPPEPLPDPTLNDHRRSDHVQVIDHPNREFQVISRARQDSHRPFFPIPSSSVQHEGSMHNDENFGLRISHHHASPNMLIPDEPVNYFRKMNSQPDSQQQQQQQSFHNELNIHRPHPMNIAPFERRIDGISIPTHHNGHSIMNEAAIRNIPSQLHHHHHRQQFEVPSSPLIRMKRNVASQVEPNDDGHETDSEQPRYTGTSLPAPPHYTMSETENSSNDTNSGKDLKSSASGYFGFDENAHHHQFRPRPNPQDYTLFNMNPYQKMPFKSPFAMQSRAPHRKRQISAYFPSTLQSHKNSYGMLGSGNFEVIRGGIYSDDDSRSSSDSYMSHGMIERPRPTSSGSEFDDFGESFTKHPFSSDEYFSNNPILGFQGYDNFKAASNRKSTDSMEQDVANSPSSSHPVHVYVDHELMAAS